MRKKGYRATSGESLRRWEVAEDTYYFLRSQGIMPKKVKRDQLGNELRKSFEWAIDEISKKRKVEFLAFSGEADPKPWNFVRDQLMTALDAGITYTHCVGPVLCTDNGRSAIAEAYRDYGKSGKATVLFFRDRYPYHWRLFTSTGSLSFELFGECYHEPLAPIRKTYHVSLKAKQDPNRASKTSFWHARQREYTWLTPIMDKFPVDEIPTITEKQLLAVSSYLKQEGEKSYLLDRERLQTLVKKLNL